MSNLQENLTIVQNTVSELAQTINDMSIANGGSEIIDSKTSFADYPSILKNIANSTGGIVTVFAYRVSDVNPGIPEDKGSFDFNTNTYTPPKNWSAANELISTESDTIWMTQAMFARTIGSARAISSDLISDWSAPIRISSFSSNGLKEISQTVYLSTKTDAIPNKPVGTNVSPLNNDSISLGWSETYPSISKDRPYTWLSVRKVNGNEWGPYSTPALCAYYATDGEAAVMPTYTRTAFAFKATNSRYNNPGKPIGGYWDLNFNDVILPEGWYESPNTDSENIYSWLSNATFSSDRPTDPIWSDPVCITGDDGVDGTDGVNAEFIYALFESREYAEIFKTHLINKNISLEISATDTVPRFVINGFVDKTSMNLDVGSKFITVQLTDSPVGIDEQNKVELYWTRTHGKHGWNSWIGPMYWSVWGENGMDGDGIEYIFSVSQDASCDNLPPTYAYLLEHNPAEAKKFQEKEYVPAGWSDNDPNEGVNEMYPYLFCCSRKQYTDESTGEKMWGDFSTPKVWGHWGKDGSMAYTSFAFCVSKEDLSKYTVTGGYHGDSLKGLVTKNEKGEVISDFKWYDTTPKVPAFDESIWMINKFFNGSSGEDDAQWYGPNKMVDSEHFQVEFNCPEDGDSRSNYDGSKKLPSFEDFKELKSKENPPVVFKSNEELEKEWRKYVYANGYGVWNDGGSGAVYMATARFVNNKWEDWSVNKIQGEAGDSTQFVFKVTQGQSIPDNPTPDDTTGEYQKDSFIPTGWTSSPQSVSESYPVCWVAQRSRVSGVWKRFSDPTEWAMYAKGNVHLELTEDEVNVPCEDDGRVDPDYRDFITVGILLYDNGTKVSADYTALINDDIDDYKITAKLTTKPTNPAVSGFLGDTLYIGRDFLSRYVNDSKLRVECQAKYSATGDHKNGVPYTKAFTINKSTNTYELSLSHSVLHVNIDGKFKDKILSVQPIKWSEDTFYTEVGGYLEWVVNYSDGTSKTYGSAVDPGGKEDINLETYTRVSSIQLNYKLESGGETKATETIGTILDQNAAISQFMSQVFCRTNCNIGSVTYRPTGGSYSEPVPSSNIKVPDWNSASDVSSTNTTTWSDGIPPYDSTTPKQIWMSQRIFYSDGSHDTSTQWSVPVLLQDTNETDIRWSDSEDYPDTPDKNPHLWYDGDDSSGNNITKNPTWMAIQHTVSGIKQAWVVSRVKGEKGEKGDQGSQGPQGPQGPKGEPGDNGGFGPMARYSVWSDIANRPSYYFSREDAEADGSRWYDIVIYDNCYYLCKKMHQSSISPTPGTNSDVWEQSSHFSFLTAENAAIQNLVSERIQSESISASKLVTSGNGALIKLEAGTMKVYGSVADKLPDITFGVEDGVAVLQFFDKQGNLLYDLGPTYGLRSFVKETIKQWDKIAGKEVRMGISESPDVYEHLSDLAQEMIKELTSNNFSWDSGQDIFRYSCTENSVPCHNNGILSANKSESSPLTGWWASNHRTYSYYDLSDEDFSTWIKDWQNEYISYDLKKGNSFSGHLHTCVVTYYVGGRGTDSHDMMWIK